MVGILHMTSKVLYSFLGKASTKGNDQKKCKVLLKDAILTEMTGPGKISA